MESQIEAQLESMLESIPTQEDNSDANNTNKDVKDSRPPYKEEEIGSEDTEDSDSSDEDTIDTDETDTDEEEFTSDGETSENEEAAQKKTSKKKKAKKKKRGTEEQKTKETTKKQEKAPKKKKEGSHGKPQPAKQAEEKPDNEQQDGEDKVASSGRAARVAAAKRVLVSMGVPAEVHTIKVVLGKAINTITNEVLSRPPTAKGMQEAIGAAVEKLKHSKIFSKKLSGKGKKNWFDTATPDNAPDTNPQDSMVPRYGSAAGTADNVLCFMHAVLVCGADRATAAKATSALEQGYLLKHYLAPYQGADDSASAEKEVYHNAMVTACAMQSVVMNPMQANELCGGKGMIRLAGQLAEHEISSHFNVNYSSSFRNQIYTVPATAFYSTLFMYANSVCRKMVTQGKIGASARGAKADGQFSVAFSGAGVKRQRNGAPKNDSRE